MQCDAILFELNQTCNLDCEYCFYRDYGRVKDNLLPTQLKKILNQYDSIGNIYFTGGECTINPYFEELLSIAEKKAPITIFTNGVTLNDESFSKEIDKYISNYIITFDSYDEDYFCRKRINDTLTTIKKMVQKSPEKLIVKICINKYNIDHLEDIIKYLKKIGVKKISINFVHNIKKNSNNFEISKDEKKKVFEILDLYEEIRYIKYYEEIKAYVLNDTKNNLIDNCKAGREFFFYDCKGNKHFCPAEYKVNKNCISKECISLFEMF